MTPRTAIPYEVAVVHASDTFVFESGSRMRTTLCLVCNQAVGPHPVAIIGVAALDGAPCSCGGVTADVYLIHTSHMPVNPVMLRTAITRALGCDMDHSSH